MDDIETVAPEPVAVTPQGFERPAAAPLSIEGVTAPYSLEVQTQLRAWQDANHHAPLNCPNQGIEPHPLLVPLQIREDGWFCPHCDYVQAETPAYMLGEPANPVNEAPPPEELEAPTLDSMDPASLVAGDPTDVEVHFVGTGFVDGSVIVFNNFDEPTTYNSATDLSTIVKPSIFVAPDPAVPVKIRNPDGQESAVAMFAFTAAA